MKKNNIWKTGWALKHFRTDVFVISTTASYKDDHRKKKIWHFSRSLLGSVPSLPDPATPKKCSYLLVPNHTSHWARNSSLQCCTLLLSGYTKSPHFRPLFNTQDDTYLLKLIPKIYGRNSLLEYQLIAVQYTQTRNFGICIPFFVECTWLSD